MGGRLAVDASNPGSWTATRAGHTVIWHNGQTGGYSAFFALFPEVNRAVVVLANVARAAEPQRIALALVRANGS